MASARFVRRAALALGFLTLVTGTAVPRAHASSGLEGVPAYDHIFVVVMENHGYDQIISSTNTNTMYINALASTYNLATNYYATTHPSLPNYMDMIAGSNFGNGAPFDPNGFPDTNAGNDNSPCFSAGTPGATTPCDPTITAPSLVDQLRGKGLTWKTYQENLPAVGSNWANSTTNGSVDKLYAVKHNPFMYFATVQNDPNELNNVVPASQLTTDLANGTVPNYSFIAPNQCHDMHGDGAAQSPCAGYSDAQLLQAGDNYLKGLTSAITSSATWGNGNNAIVILWDENDYGTESNKVPVIVITNHATSPVQDTTLYNGGHYSLLRTVEDAFGISDYLNSAQTAAPMVALFGGSGPGGNPTPSPTTTPEAPSVVLVGAGVALALIASRRRRRSV